MTHRSEDLRNLGLFGHSHGGKTALIDALAFLTKITGRHGNTADGSSISNNEPEEKERKQTLNAHQFRFPFDKVTINVVDTPGHPDFLADAYSAMRVVETGILCVSAANPVTFHARRLWGEMGRAGVGRAIMVTHLDAENVDFDEVVETLREAFGDSVVPATYPDKSGPGFASVHDVLAGEGPRAKELFGQLEEHVAEADDEVLAKYLDAAALERAEFDSHFAAAVVKGKLVPVFAACPPKMHGIQKFCAIVQSHFASPVAYGSRPAGKPGAETFDQLLAPDAGAPFAAKVWKVVIDPYVGRVSYLRCLRGKLKSEEGFLNVRTGKHEKVGALLQVQGKDTKPFDMVVAGDLFAVGKIEDLHLWDAATADAHPVRFEPVQYPAPTFALAAMPKSRGDEQKIGHGLEKLAAEDPTFHVHRDPNTGEMIVSGMSPLHLETQLHRLNRRYGVGTVTHPPTIPYKETVTARAEGHHRHKKQTGGRGQFGEVYLRVLPRERGAGFEFVDSVVGGSIPRQFIPEVEKGVRKFLVHGALAGFPVVDCAAEVYDGKFHDVDSDQISFQIAGERAFADGFAKARPILLEPIVTVEIFIPERFTGDVAGNLSSIRGRMSGMEVHEGIQVITAQVPLAEMQDYSTKLRSITAGEGTFTMKPSHYEQVPPNVQAEIVARYKKAQEEQHHHK
jgi:elongation factor G